MSIKLTLDGFDELVKQIEKAQGNVDAAVTKCVDHGAKILQEELKAQMQSAGVDGDLISRMPNYEMSNDHGLISAKVGYQKGDYNPRNPSDGYKVVFLNYGTPRRTKHGQIKDKSEGGTVKLGFIKRAKSKAKPKIRAAQEKTLKDIIGGLVK